MGKIQFCDKCDKILEIKGKDNKLIAVCSCGFSKEVNSDITFTEKIRKKIIGEGIAEEIETGGFPHTCKKCGHGECDVFDAGVVYSDESNIYLYRCKKCKWVERQADGTGNS